jgi:hypothetical protein
VGYHRAAYDFAMCELRSVLRSLASVLVRTTAVTITPSKITQAHAVNGADVILPCNAVLEGTKPPARNMIGRRLRHASPGKCPVNQRTEWQSSSNKTRLLILMAAG